VSKLFFDVSNSKAIEDYAKAVYVLGIDRDGLVPTGEVAVRLGVTPATATAMLQKLAELGFAEYVPYKGVALTDAGERVALEVIRHHRLLELFLAEALEMPWDRVHAEAEVLEHVLSEELEELIAAKLGEPALDPHGDPIPDRDLAISADDSVALTDLDPGEEAVFTRVSDSDASMLRYLAERAIQPGASLVVTLGHNASAVTTMVLMLAVQP